MKYQSLAGVCVLLALASHTGASELFTDLSFDDACKRAKADGKVVLVDFYTTWCEPCKMLDRNTWSAADVIEAVSKTAVPLRVDAEKQAQLAERYKVDAFPTVLLVKPDGTEINRLVGYRGPAEFVKDFQAAREGKDPVAAARAATEGAGATDLAAHMKLAMALRTKQDYAGATREYFWCFDHAADKNPAAEASRGILLVSILTMEKNCPAVRQELVTRRDQCEVRLLGGSQDASLARDLAQYNACLKCPEKCLHVFDRLPAGSKARDELRPVVISQLLAAKRYQDVLDGTDPTASFEQSWSTVRQRLATFPEETRHKLESQVRKMFSVKVLGYYEALLDAGKDQDAKAMADRLLKIDPAPEMLTSLTEIATRTGHPDLAKSLHLDAKPNPL